MENLYEECYNLKCGNFIKTSNPIEFESLLKLENMPIKGLEHIKPGDKTDMYEWFIHTIEYKGILTDEEGLKAIITYMGKMEGDIFSPEDIYIYDVTYVITPERIGKSYMPRSFRDFILKIDENGKYYWK